MPPDDVPQPVTPHAFPPTDAERTRIRQLLKRIRNPHFLYHNLDSSLPAHLDDASFSFLSSELEKSLLFDLEKSQDRDWCVRAVAAWALGVSANSIPNRLIIIEHLREVLQNRLAKKSELVAERFGKAVLRTFVCCYPFLAIFACLLISFVENDMGNKSGNWLANILMGLALSVPCSLLATVFLLPFSFPPLVVDAIFSNNQARAMAAQALFRQNALEALPDLLEFSCDKSLEVKEQCRLALTHFLPQITQANHDLMPLNSEELIGKLLEDKPNLTLGNIILDYLEQFGTGRSCMVVGFYLKKVLAPNHKQEYAEVYAKGREVYILLLERRELIQEGALLLRHSSAPATQSNELLRPAADAQTTPAEQLLRAATSQE